MKALKHISILIIIILLSACSSTKDSTSDRNHPAPMQVQNWQERQQELQDESSRSGLTIDEIKKLEDYAEQKVELVCEMMEYDRQNNEALSEVEANDIKNNIVKLDKQITSLTKEIDSYCDTDERRNYFDQIYRHRLRRCQSD